MPLASRSAFPLTLAALAAAIPLAPAHAADGVDCLYENLTDDERAGVYAILGDLARWSRLAGSSPPAAMRRAIDECRTQNKWTGAAAAQAVVVFGSQMAFADARGRAAAWGLSTSQLEDLFLALGSDNMVPADGRASPAALDQLSGLLRGMDFPPQEAIREVALAWLQANAAVSDQASLFNEI